MSKGGMMRIRFELGMIMLACSSLLLAIFSVLQVSAAPSGTTYYVDPAGSNANACTSPGASACKTIAGALGKAANGDSIVVAASTYHEHLTINKNVSVNGAGAAGTIVDGGKTQRADGHPRPRSSPSPI